MCERLMNFMQRSYYIADGGCCNNSEVSGKSEGISPQNKRNIIRGLFKDISEHTRNARSAPDMPAREKITETHSA